MCVIKISALDFFPVENKMAAACLNFPNVCENDLDEASIE